MLYHSSYNKKTGIHLFVCGSFWPGAPEKNKWYEHMIKTNYASAHCQSRGEKCECE